VSFFQGRRYSNVSVAVPAVVEENCILWVRPSKQVTNTLLHAAERLNLRNRVVFVLVVTALSNLVSDVPTVMLLKGLIPQLGHPHQMWLLLAMSSTLAGNLTITGSVANTIVVEKTRTVTHISLRHDVKKHEFLLRLRPSRWDGGG
jgi:hypothetical protein